MDGVRPELLSAIEQSLQNCLIETDLAVGPQTVVCSDDIQLIFSDTCLFMMMMMMIDYLFTRVPHPHGHSQLQLIYVYICSCLFMLPGNQFVYMILLYYLLCLYYCIYIITYVILLYCLVCVI